jgi:hypothetical protein
MKRILLIAGAAVAAAFAGGSANATHVAPFVGTWQNDDPATQAQTRAVVGVVGADFTVSGYGSCSPTECDWASAVGGPRTTPQSDASDGELSIYWDFGFKTMSQTLRLLPDGRLHIHSFNHFTDGSGRQDYTLDEDFHKTTAPAVFFTLQLGVAGKGHGQITSVPIGLDCPVACSLEFQNGTSVKLTATPSKGSKLVGWRGACSGKTRTCTVAIGADTAATAVFAPNPPCIVPHLKQKTLAGARRAIGAAHCTLAKVKRVYSSRVRKGLILGQAPARGSHLPNGGRVTVVVSRGARP